MKIPSLNLLIAALTVNITLSSSGEDSAKPKMRDAATHDQLSQTLRMAQQKDPIRDMGPAIGKTEEDPAKALAGRDLIKDSAILCYRGSLTLVPKRAVLHLPDALKDRFEEKSKVKVISWKDFYQSNRGWIRTVEVSREQAMGQAPMNEEVTKSFEQSTSAVIATFKGGPISVLPYVAPEEPSDKEEEADGKSPAEPLASAAKSN